MKRILLGLAMLAATSAWAQDTATDALLAHVPRQAIRFSPFHLFGFYPTLEFSVEQRLYNQVTLLAEYGYVLNYSNSNRFSKKRGYKAKGELRYYISQYKRVTVYGAGEYYWNAIQFDRWVQRQEYFDQYPILVKVPHIVNYDEYGFAVKGGILLHIPHNIFFDFNVGLRMRVIDYDAPPLASNEEYARSDGDLFRPDEYDRTIPGIVVGIRIGYRFR
jgi:hypothetical protein